MIDYMKAYSIMAVVLYHTQLQPDIKYLSYLLCLPAFFFTSGLFADKQSGCLRYFKKKTLRLLIPYLIFGILSGLLWYFIGSRYGSDADTEHSFMTAVIGLIYGTSNTLVQNAPLWFLCCLMILEWLFFAITRISNNIYIQCIVVILVTVLGLITGYYNIVLPWSMTAAMIMLPIYYIGYKSSNYIKNATNSLNKTKIFTVMLISIVGIILVYTYNKDVKISMGKVNNIVLFYTGIISVVAFMFSISIITKRLNCVSVILRFIGQNTLWILCIHIPVFGLIKGIAMLLNIPLSFFATNTGSIILWLLSFIIILPAVHITRKIIGHYT